MLPQNELHFTGVQGTSRVPEQLPKIHYVTAAFEIDNQQGPTV